MNPRVLSVNVEQQIAALRLYPILIKTPGMSLFSCDAAALALSRSLLSYSIEMNVRWTSDESGSMRSSQFSPLNEK